MQCESKPTQRHVYLYIIYYIYIMIHVYHRLLSIFGYFRGLRRKNTSVNSPRFRRWPSPEAASGRRGLMWIVPWENQTSERNWEGFWMFLHVFLNVVGCCFMFWMLLDLDVFGMFFWVFLGVFGCFFGMFFGCFGMSWVGMATGTLPFVSTCMLVDFPKGTGGAFLEEGSRSLRLSQWKRVNCSQQRCQTGEPNAF